MDIFGVFALFSVPVLFLILALPLYFIAQVSKKAGYSPWWCLIALLPPVNIVMLWVFAYADWPNMRK